MSQVARAFLYSHFNVLLPLDAMELLFAAFLFSSNRTRILLMQRNRSTQFET